ncbi:MAG: hypothetical protein RLP14_04515 [Owenweeksia sp.]
MKKSTLGLLLLGLVLISSCKNSDPEKKEEDKLLAPTTFSYRIEMNNSMTHLPALQSFVLGTSGDYWLLIGGRTNGFHGFGNQQNFPFKKANKHIYAYNTANNTLDSISINNLPPKLQEQYTSSNMQHFQLQNYLYICGGYGEINANTPDSNWVTYPTFSRVDVSAMINAVVNQDVNALANSVVYEENDFQRATGGELYKLGQKFYLVLGHNFEGPYGGTSTQVYLDSVHVFTLTETDSSISIDPSSFQYISDNLNDSITQFRRRDLLVVPSVADDKSTVGLTVYGGVFTSPVLHDSTKANQPFRNPIYLQNGTTPSYTLDQNFTQRSNIYSSAFVTLYDSTDNVMFTTSFGGMGDTAVGAGDAFTKLILTIGRANPGNNTYTFYNANSMPDYLGTEADFIPSSQTMFNSEYGIVDFRSLPENTEVLLGHIYGGIKSKGPSWDPVNNPTSPSNEVYNVYITRN